MDESEIETLDEEYLEELPADKRLPIPKQWTHFNTIRMLDAYVHFIPKKGSYLTKKQFFEDIALYLEKDNIFFTGYQVENKFRGLLRTHRLTKQKGKYFSKINNVAHLDSSIREEHYLQPTSELEVTFSQNEEDVDEEEDIEKMDTRQQGPKSSQNKKSKKMWLIDDVHKLVDEYERLLPQKSSCPIKKDWWNALASNLRDMGVICNGINCEIKWNNLVKFYKNKGKNYTPRLKLHKQIERIRVSQGLDTASNVTSDDEKGMDDVLDDDEDEYLIPKNTKENIVVKTEPETYENEKVVEINLPAFEPRFEPRSSNQSFEDLIINYLEKKEIATQQRHEEMMEIKKKQLLLLEKYLSQK